MKKNISTMTALVCCFVFFLAAGTGGINGNWTGNVRVEGSEHTINFYFNVDSENVTGTSYQDQDEPKAINAGKINGNDFKFSFSNRDGEMFPMTGKYYADGDSIALNIDNDGTNLHARLNRVVNK